jgi:hypothetical protein
MTWLAAVLRPMPKFAAVATPVPIISTIKLSVVFLARPTLPLPVAATATLLRRPVAGLTTALLLHPSELLLLSEVEFAAGQQRLL